MQYLKVYFFCFSIAISSSVYSQTGSETIDYLKTHYSEVSDLFNQKISFTYKTDSLTIFRCIKHSDDTRSCIDNAGESINWADIMGVEFKYQPYRLLSKSGTAKKEQFACWLFKIMRKSRATIQVGIDPQKEINYLREFKDAVVKYAASRGANLYFENIFD